MIEFLEFVEANKPFFWMVPAACFVGAIVLVMVHRRRQTMPVFEIDADNVMRPASPKATNEAWQRK